MLATQPDVRNLTGTLPSSSFRSPAHRGTHRAARAAAGPVPDPVSHSLVRHPMIPARRLPIAFALLLLACARPAEVESGPAAGAAPTMPSRVVYLARHAEKADESADPPLSEAGRARADALRERLRAAGIATVIVSDRRRTAETAEPLARAAGVAPVVVSTAGGGGAHVAAVAEAVRRAWNEGRGPVLVVGHSNTVPLIARALGAADAPDICDSEYSNLWIVTAAEGASPVLRRERFGAADAAARTGCPATMPRD